MRGEDPRTANIKLTSGLLLARVAILPDEQDVNRELQDAIECITGAAYCNIHLHGVLLDGMHPRMPS
jgi:hypothetical protein